MRSPGAAVDSGRALNIGLEGKTGEAMDCSSLGIIDESGWSRGMGLKDAIRGIGSEACSDLLNLHISCGRNTRQGSTSGRSLASGIVDAGLDVFDKSQVYIVVLGLAADAEATGGDIWKDNTHEFSERSRIQGLQMVFCASHSVLSVHPSPGNGAFGLDEVLIEPGWGG
jgi:hypothetical protein